MATITYTFEVIDSVVEMTRLEDGTPVEVRELQKGIFNVMTPISSPPDNVVITLLNDDRESGHDIKVPYEQCVNPIATSVIDLVQKLRPLFSPVASTGGGGGDVTITDNDTDFSTNTEQQLIKAEVVGVKNNTVRGNLARLKAEANDLVRAYTYLDQGTSDERVNTITYSSVALSLNVTKTYTYTPSSPYSIVTTTVS